MSVKALSDYTFYSRYSQYLPELKRRETWDESVKRVFGMHRKKYQKQLEESSELREAVNFAEQYVIKKRVLGSQRALQYGGDPILKKNERIYNCSALYINTPKALQDIAYLLLTGTGVGFSVQYQHVNQLPKVEPITKSKKVFVIPDSIEGWADSVGVVFSAFFENGGQFPEFKGHDVEFDFSKIREKGALIAGQFKAPGPEPLKRGLQKIKDLLIRVTKDGVHKMSPLEVYDCMMYASDFVIAGGLRRSATICLFSKEDVEMTKAKTGSWRLDNPQRARSNNSVVLQRDEVTKEEFDEIFKSIRDSGEPGFYFCTSKSEISNPCVEIGFYNELPDGRTGVNFCNLCEINGKFCFNEENFYKACRAATIIGTLQAGYDSFPYLGATTEEIVRKEALLGVSITGWMDNPDILFNPEILKRGAEVCKETNAYIASIIGINPAARLTCSKPSGHTSCILGTASGIHPHHARRYIRRVQSNKQEFALKVFAEHNPISVEHSVWSANDTDDVVSFLCEVPAGAITKNQINAIDFLEKVKIAQQNWVKNGTRPERAIYKHTSHNVSNTIHIKDDEWDAVRDYIFENRRFFTGISILSASGDLDYAQSPFTSVLTPNEMVREYGEGCMFASGLIVDGQHAFDNNLWNACDCVLGVGEKLESDLVEPQYPQRRNFAELSKYFKLKDEFEKNRLKIDWVRRLKKFASRYFGFDIELHHNREEEAKFTNKYLVNKEKLKKATHCLKHTSILKDWVDMKREYKDIDWDSVQEAEAEYKNIDEQSAVACAGGKCELSF